MFITCIPKHIVYEKIDSKSINNNNMDTNITYGKFLSQEDYIYYYQQSWRDKWENIPENTHKAKYIIDLTSNELQILQQAGSIGILTLRRPLSLDDELGIIENLIPIDINSTDKYFVRINQCSTKDSMYGISPLFTPKEIINSIVTSHRCYYNLKNYTNNKIYIVPWDDNWHTNGFEWRVFYFEGKLTAISQHNILAVYNLTKPQIIQIAAQIIIFCNKVCISMQNINYNNKSNWVIDVISIDNNIELVEINTFGAELPAGSALFDWNTDVKQLYGKNDKIEIRVVIE